MAEPVLVLDGDAPTVVIQNDLLRYLFTDDDEEQEPWQPAPPN